MNALAIVPTYNERDNLESLAEAILSRGLQVLVVDDQSSDGTGELADELARKHPGRLDVLHRAGPKGLGRSYIDGMRLALDRGADLIVQMDADWSHDPQYLPAMLDAASQLDVVLGSRYLHGVSVVNWPLHRIFLSTFANRYIRLVTRLGIHDCTSGYRCWHRDALERVLRRPIASDGYAFQFEMLWEAARAGCRIGEVPIIFVERRQGQSKLSSGVLVESLLMPWRLMLRGWFRRDDR